jgi:tRNA dimethylallyltransferase
MQIPITKAKKKLIIIGGPTSSGKTDFAIQIAKKLSGELINADSRQIYKFLDIGTNKGVLTKPPESSADNWLIKNTPIHLINFLDPDKRFSVYDYKIQAERKIHEIFERKKQPILVGGTGLYIDSLIKDYDLKENNYDPALRTKLENKTVKELLDILKTENLKLLTRLNESDRLNPRRLIRLIEKSYLENISINTSHESIKLSKKADYEILFLYPEYNWEALKARIDKRVEQMFREGLVDETKDVLNMGFKPNSVALQGIGYRQVLEYLDKKISLEQCIELVKTAYKQYARRQRTWFEGTNRKYNLTRVDFNGNPSLAFLSSFFP